MKILTKTNLTLALLTLIAIITQGWVLLASYTSTPTGLSFAEFHDALWHLSLIKEFDKGFPIMHPGLSGVPLKNYHYLSDLFLWIISKLTLAPVWFVYYRIGPVIASTLFTLSAYLTSKQLTKTNPGKYASTILILFGGSFAWLIPLLTSSKVWRANSFMIDQPFDMLTNVHTYFGFGLFLLGFYFFIRSFRAPPSTVNKLLILSGLIIGISFGFKAYAGVIGLIALAAASLYQLMFSRKAHLITYSFIPAVTIFLFIFLFNSTSSQAGLVFAPAWLLDKMVEDSGRLEFLSDLALKKQHYLATNNNLRLTQLFLQKLGVYLLGNLGTRSLGIFTLFLWVQQLQKLNPVKIFFIAATTASLAIPVWFNQGASSYNIVQFGPYALILMSIATVVFVEKIIKNTSSRILAFILIVLLSLPTSVKSFFDSTRTPMEENFVTNYELKALDFLKTDTPTNSIILTSPDSRHHLLMIIPGLAGRRTYFSGDTFSVLTGANKQNRVNQQRKFFNPMFPLKSRQKFLSDAKINYIYLTKPQLDIFSQEEQSLGLTLVFRNQEVVIFQVKETSAQNDPQT